MLVRPADAVALAARVLESLGTPPDAARRVGEWLVASDLAGHPSHGMTRVVDYARRIEKGDLVPTGTPEIVQGEDGGPVVLIDGNAGYGHLAADLLVRELVSRVRKHGVATGGIVNASHTGRLGEWAEQAAEEKVVLFMCTSSLARGNVAAFGAREARLGTNPVTFAAPAADGDVALIDYATSEISGGKIDQLIRTGQQAPEGTMLDRHGEPTTDPNAFYEGGALIAFGGHKGYGLALLVSILGGCVVGQAAPGNPRHGVFAFAVDAGLFADRGRVLAATSDLLGRMRSTPPLDGFERVEVPGDYEARRREAQADTLDVADGAWSSIVELAEALGVSTEGAPA